LKQNGDWVTTTNSNSTYDANARSGVQFLRESYSATNEYVWTAGFYLTENHLYDFSFWWAGDGYAGWEGAVFFNATQSSSGATPIGSSFVTASTVTSKTYSQVHNQFTVPSSGIYYFAIRVNASSTPWYLSFDDFMMEEVAPECPVPVALTANSITENSAAISWSGVYFDYSIEYGPSGFSLGSGTRIEHVSSPYTLIGLSPNTAYSYYVGSICFPGPYGTNWNGPGFFTTLTPQKTLNITCLVQGLYNGSGGLNKAQGESGDEFPGNIADQVSIELHHAINGSLLYLLENVSLSTSGQISITIPGNYNGSYYVYIRNRNSIITSSAIPLSFSGNSISYDFTTGASQAYGNNLMLMTGGLWVVFGGDVNQDGLVDSSDMILVDNSASGFASGYIPSDTNGDGLIDSSDMILVDNNVSIFAGAILPF
jgi:hypothetical protein